MIGDTIFQESGSVAKIWFR